MEAINRRLNAPILPEIAAIWAYRRQRSSGVVPEHPEGTRGTRGDGTKAWRPGATAGRQKAKNSLLMHVPIAWLSRWLKLPY